MDEYQNVKYSKSFLNEVILRIDFLQFVDSADIFSPEVEEAVLKNFPRRGKNQQIHFNSINLTFNLPDSALPSTSGETQDGFQREYYSATGNNKVLLSNKFIIFTIDQYDSFENHLQWFRNILIPIFSKKRIATERIGIRYINLFETEKIKLQKNYFAPEISAALVTKVPVVQDELSLVRSMHLAEYHVSTMTLHFRYGMFNPNYPNLLTKNSFSLDFDCFTNEPVDAAEKILNFLEISHSYIQSLFESSITDSLRQVMQNE